MKIMYVGRHRNQHSNDDEGAITRSLLDLGHQVKIVQERKLTNMEPRDCDFILFHHCKQFNVLRSVNLPKVFWCFDRIYWDDPKLAYRNNQRVAWADTALTISALGFFTDGDWVDQDRTGKARWLTQGFNQCLPALPPSGEERSKDDKGTILFTGGGKDYGREAFVEEMERTYGERFVHISKGVHGKELAQAIADASICVAPPSPITDRYWSNRVYLTLGLGGFLLHPFTQGLVEDLGIDLVFYRSMQELHEHIDFYTRYVGNRETMRRSGRYQVMQHHTYKHRVAQLIDQVKEIL